MWLGQNIITSQKLISTIIIRTSKFFLQHSWDAFVNLSTNNLLPTKNKITKTDNLNKKFDIFYLIWILSQPKKEISTHLHEA